MTDNLFSVEGQVVLASGASRGIGLALAKGFAERGATVVVTGREKATIDAAAKEIGATGMVCDIASEDDVRRTVDAVVEQFERLDTLINVAGINIRKPAESFTAEEYDRVVGVNIRGAFLMAQAAGQQMLAQGKGNIINIDSLNSHAPVKHVVPYAISKGGMKTMTRALAMEWGDRGVRVNGIAPGFILTDLTTKLWSEPVMNQWGKTNTPMGRLGVPEDLVGTALFLASKGAAFLTGQTIYVDGGFVAGIPWPIDRI